ncbi:MAG: L-allo-threonine aldolase [Firmicutes bacterium]|nr:L-allo-threonine aldolase [Bacillota bacterium]
MKIIDLRSDTVTLPTPAMREAMYSAEVGDDVYGEDPTVNRLEELGAELLGKEKALFVTSGTQGNLLALMVHCQRGDEVILETESHIFLYEVGGISAIAGLVPKCVPGKRGIMQPEDVAGSIRADNIHFPKTSLLCLENTHNRAGGSVANVQQMEGLGAIARAHGISIHLDGARLFNASVALSLPAAQLVASCDSVSLCLSKGLGAPVGSLLVGGRDFIGKARKVRKMLGGGMRQAGIIAAAGVVALKTMVERLRFDHGHARYLAEGLLDCGFHLDLAQVETNIVIASTAPLGLSATEVVMRLAGVGVNINALDNNRVRFVTHLNVDRADISEVLSRLHALGRSWRATGSSQ